MSFKIRIFLFLASVQLRISWLFIRVKQVFTVNYKVLHIIEYNPEQATPKHFTEVNLRLHPNNPIKNRLEKQINTKYLQKCLVLFDQGLPQARLAVYLNPEHTHNNERVATIGYFECPNKPVYANLLLAKAEELANEHGAKHLIGPMNGSTWESYRFRCKTENPPFFLEPNNPDYYSELFENFGFKVLSNYSSYIFNEIEATPTKIAKREQQLTEQGISIQAIDPLNYERDVCDLFKLSLACFANNYLYSTTNWEQFAAKYKAIGPFTNPQETLIARNSQNEAIAFLFTFQNILNAKKTSQQIIESQTFILKYNKHKINSFYIV